MNIIKLLNLLNQIVLPLMLILSINYVNCDTLKIYDNLVQCYRNDSSKPWIPNTLQILLELIRKIEDYHPTSMDIRYLSVSLIHQLRIDGIQKASEIQETEYITPYNPNGIQSNKFSILLKLISNVPGKLNFDEILTHSELCTLHRLISSSIEPSIRGDEFKTCKNPLYDVNSIPADRFFVYSNDQKPYLISQKISKCPLENGIVRTYNYDTFSPGIVIASIAAGLQPQLIQLREFVPTLETTNDRYKNLETMEEHDTNQKIRRLLRSSDSIDNTYSANLAGDLAEVCVYQAPYYRKNVSVGLVGYWNDTEYPIIRYINEQNSLNWCFTDSEILAGIDGYHLSKNIMHWVNRMSRMKLSQILEMYYSPRGIINLLTENSNRIRKGSGTSQRLLMPINQDDFQNGQGGGYYDTDRYGDSACERRNILNRIPKEKLKDETFYLAQLLQYSTNSVTVDDNLLKTSCSAAVDKFFDYAQTLLSRLPKCVNLRRPSIDLTLIIDGSRTRFENLQLISFISEIIDVSSFASRIAVIHGGSGKYMVNPTHSIVNAFDELKQFSEPFPNSLSLTESLSSVIHNLEKTKHENLQNSQISDLSQVILVISQSQEIRQDDFDGAKRLIDGSFQAYPDIYFTFVTNNRKSFLDLIKDAGSLAMNPKDKYTIIESTALNPKELETNLIRTLRSIPKWLHISSCENSKKYKPGEIDMTRNDYEDYVHRDHANIYRINGHQLLQYTEIRVNFEGTGYGIITVCKEIDSRPIECLTTQNLEDESIWFNMTNLCNDNICPSVNFRVELDNSNVKCTENSCRYPDSVRYNIRLENDKCSKGSLIKPKLISILLILLSVFSIKFPY